MVVRVVPPYDAVSVIVNAPPVARLVTVKAALVAPAATVTLDAVAATVGSLLCRDTTAPPVGAADVSVTEPFTDAPPVIVELSVEIPNSVGVAGGGTLVTVSDAD